MGEKRPLQWFRAGNLAVSVTPEDEFFIHGRLGNLGLSQTRKTVIRHKASGARLGNLGFSLTIHDNDPEQLRKAMQPLSEPGVEVGSPEEVDDPMLATTAEDYDDSEDETEKGQETILDGDEDEDGEEE